MRIRTRSLSSFILTATLLSCASNALAQTAAQQPAAQQTAVQASSQFANESRFVLDLGFGFDLNISGNVNSGAIGTLQGQTVAILPNPYGDVYGTGLHFRFGGGYRLKEDSELRGVFTYQTADANLVRMGDLGASSLYGQYSDYKTLGLDLGYRHYAPLKNTLRVYGEATIGIAYVETININLAAPQANIIFDETDFYDQAAAFTWGLNIGALYPIKPKIDINLQIGLRSVSGLSDVDQLVGTGLDTINDDSGRLTFPVVMGVRFRF